MMPEQMPLNHEDQLEEALGLLAAGLTPEDVLAEFDGDASWLEPLLAAAVDLGQLKPLIPVPSGQASLQKMLSHAETMTATSASTSSPSWLAPLKQLFSPRPRLAIGLASLALLLLLIFGGLSFTAQNSLPGQPLYAIKRAGESWRLSLAGDSEQREQLLEQFNARRLMETEELLKRGQVAEVTFNGDIQEIGADEMVIHNLTIEITSETEISGQLTPQAEVLVSGITQPNGTLLAQTILVTHPGIEPPTAEPTTALPSPEPEPSLTPTPTATLSPTNTPPPTLIDTPDQAPPVNPSPTGNSTTPTATPDDTSTTGLDDNNDNESDSGDIDHEEGKNSDLNDDDLNDNDGLNNDEVNNPNLDNEADNGSGDNDNDKGHGNDADSCDEDNPGNSKKCNDDNSSDPGSGDSDDNDNDNGNSGPGNSDDNYNDDGNNSDPGNSDDDNDGGNNSDPGNSDDEGNDNDDEEDNSDPGGSGGHHDDENDNENQD